ncbi:Ecto-NOX disulfide-thiol exchanger 2 [Characodon lateralis]|uniref:Ecto-NOX disulfide-thiol exchanger 2 n=1 Tax=Characodon lateralis TaxID=208331 RepID=A0ABU7EW29_9TELE|nr:Ecto-NOX disulfide-thiol exchanger 2 [Characodon lateralis]
MKITAACDHSRVAVWTVKHFKIQIRITATNPNNFDPNLGMIAGITPINPMMPGLGMVPAPVSQDVPVVKEIIHCKSCTLFPPNPKLDQPPC